MTDGQLKIGVLSRRAPIGYDPDLGPTVEHVGGLTRVLPALAEFAQINWTALATQSQIGLPNKHSLTTISGQDYQHHIDIFLSEVDAFDLKQSDWFGTHYIWPLLHDLPIPEMEPAILSANFDSVKSVCNSIATNCIESGNQGYLVNDFQLSQVPLHLKNLEPEKPITFFLHTPWPKFISTSELATKILNFLASGMLVADVIQFQTQKDLQAFENFVNEHMAVPCISTKLEVNPVSINVQVLQEGTQSSANQLTLSESDISYLHIARIDPIKNTLATIKAFAEFTKAIKNSARHRYLDLYLVPSRQQWPGYRALLGEIVKCVELCNSELSFLGYAPIRLHLGNDYNRSIQALARYDYLLVCSVADGLNLVVKEGATLNSRNGTIISTPKVGAMAELGKFCVIAANATEEGIAQALLDAQNLDCDARKNISAELKRHIQECDASNWAQAVVANFKVLEKV